MTRFPLTTALLLLTISASVSFLYATAPNPSEKTSKPPKTPVTVMPLVSQTIPRIIDAHGTIEPARRVSLAAEVDGRITYMHPRLEEGAHFEKGDILFTLDETDYKLAVQRAESAVAIAKAELQLESGRQKVAETELAQLQKMQALEQSDKMLVLRAPQLARAKAQLAQAENDLESAKVRLNRTHVLAPFPSYITQKSVALGQVLTAGAPVLELIDSQTIHMRLPLKKADIDYIEPNQPANIFHSNHKTPLAGKVLHALPALADKIHIGQVLLSAPIPTGGSSPHLAPKVGDFVAVKITAGTIADVYAIPAAAISIDGKVAVATKTDTLKFLPVTSVWQSKNHRYVRADFKEGDRLVTSPIARRADGTPLVILELVS